MGTVLAFEWYKHVIRPTAIALPYYAIVGLSVNKAVPDKAWVGMISCLFGKKPKQADKGCDLRGYEVKSAVAYNDFDYQYNWKSGLEKFCEELDSNHVFVTRGGDKPQPARGGRSEYRLAEARPVVKPPNRTNYFLNLGRETLAA